MSRVRLVPIVLIAILALAMLFGGWQAYQHFNLLNPLKKNLQSVQGVQTVNIATGSPDEVTIHLGPFNKLENGDLQQTYHAIANEVSTRLGSGVKLNLSDDHGAQLTQVYEGDYYPILAQGKDKGNYTDMISQVSSLAKKQGIQARITMDEQYIYVQLAKGSHYLYDVIPYSTHQGGAAS
ncbi:hypothetical protein [Alicyclobacillus dauci]|uniref:Uncharacterized protein n=1 Tax=Alicyclobacillus dauci TaxID=1475485 RepID=A0ABY6YXN6_9BACL|nr:hypothetical protein [Alicyclobacillus dauci]WAH35152.1 hypothetical protein NZD86_12580 [Alicyclobacillus dauci]